MLAASPTIAWLRWVALAEAVSYISLLAAVVAKRGFGEPVGVDVIGPIHGVLFLAYAGLVLLARDELRWTLARTLVAMVAAAIPLGSLAVERRSIVG